MKERIEAILKLNKDFQTSKGTDKYNLNCGRVEGYAFELLQVAVALSEREKKLVDALKRITQVTHERETWIIADSTIGALREID